MTAEPARQTSPADPRLRVLSMIVADDPGVLFRVSGMIRRRGFNIESISVGPTNLPGCSRMTLTVDAGHAEVDQVEKQLERLVDVLEVSDVTDDPLISRELVMIRIDVGAARKDALAGIVDRQGGRILDASAEHVVVELTADSRRVDAFIESLRPYGISELARTGPVAMRRDKS